MAECGSCEIEWSAEESTWGLDIDMGRFDFYMDFYISFGFSNIFLSNSIYFEKFIFLFEVLRPRGIFW